MFICGGRYQNLILMSSPSAMGAVDCVKLGNFSFGAWAGMGAEDEEVEVFGGAFVC